MTHHLSFFLFKLSFCLNYSLFYHNLMVNDCDVRYTLLLSMQPVCPTCQQNLHEGRSGDVWTMIVRLLSKCHSNDSRGDDLKLDLQDFHN